MNYLVILESLSVGYKHYNILYIMHYSR